MHLAPGGRALQGLLARFGSGALGVDGLGSGRLGGRGGQCRSEEDETDRPNRPGGPRSWPRRKGAPCLVATQARERR
ncbi:hypothetical protein CKO45_27245 [Paracraurococcus ruber]|uniref:Uncharacterized protein n=1 Tax=Paracraurococcus ruber TaxID=77675 RepID=A0ABS1D750_9PROT|nr:hypothetical protein [Paracraurococcus ruber]